MKNVQIKKTAALLGFFFFCMTIADAQIINHFGPGKLHGKFHPQFAEHSLVHGKAGAGKTDRAECLQLQQTLGGSADEFTGLNGFAKSVNGYVTCGETSSTDGDFHVPLQNGFDGYIVKYDHSGKIVWAYTYGGTGEDIIASIISTTDGGFIGVGYTDSDDGDVKGNHGGYDIWIVKFSESGKMQWQRCFGGTDDDYSIGNILENPNGTFLFSGSAGSTDGDVTFNHGGGSDFWIVEISPRGHIIWQRSYGGSGFDDNTGLVKLSDGYISSGTTTSNDGDVAGNHGGQDSWIIKFDESGKLVWSKSLGGSGDEFDNALTKTTDGNVVLGCVTLSNDGDVSGSQYGDDMWLVKVSAHTGKIIWQKCYGTPSYGDGAFGIFATADGGVVGTGAMGTVPYYRPGHDVYVVKTGVNGNQQWAARFGGSNIDEAYGGIETSKGEFIIICQTSSSDGDVKNNHGNSDTWFLTLDKCGKNVGKTDESNQPAIIFEDETIQTNKVKVSPNPFTNSTIISFSIPRAPGVSIEIFDLNGRLIKTIANSQMQAGVHHVTWNATGEGGNAVGAGIYFLKINAGDYSETKELIIVK